MCANTAWRDLATRTSSSVLRQASACVIGSREHGGLV
jgi:hypothetical protein